MIYTTDARTGKKTSILAPFSGPKWFSRSTKRTNIILNTGKASLLYHAFDKKKLVRFHPNLAKTSFEEIVIVTANVSCKNKIKNLVRS